MARNKTNSGVRVETLKHKDKRANIPTKELRGFVEEDEKSPPTMLYPRDPSLDPQLVWKGKDEQDSKELAVPVVPIYIQEKVQPQAIIEEVRAQARSDRPEPQAALFSDFNGITFEDLVDFYHHEQNWSNRLILGDSLLVMTSLAEKEGLKGKVQMIYMDPPYGIKFGSNWQVSTRRRDVKDGKIEDFTNEPEQVKAFRDTWELGIHSYLAYLRDRVEVARELLSETGSIFAQIGDENVHLVRNVLDEVFGAENFISQIAFRKTAGATSEFLASTADHILLYAKMRERLKYRPLYLAKGLAEGGAGAYDFVELPDGTRCRLTQDQRANPQQAEALGRIFRHQILTSPRIREARTGYYPVDVDGKEYLPTTGEWKTHRQGMERLVGARRVAVTGTSLSYVRYVDDFPAYPLANSTVREMSPEGLSTV